MTTAILDGLEPARVMLAATAVEARVFAAAQGRPPCLALVTAKAPPALAYAERIAEFATRAGIVAQARVIEPDTTPAALLALIADLGRDVSVDGILPLAPLVPGLALARIGAALPAAKDVDGLGPENAGRLACGLDGLAPCTPQAAIHLAERACGSLAGKRATVVGASAGVGMPLAQMLVRRGATVTIAHAETRDLPAACRNAEVLFVAVGRAGLIGADHVAPGAVVIDIGINVIVDEQGQRRVVGDVDAQAVAGRAAALSAVPDGVGPLTTAFLMANVMKAARAR